MVLTLLSTCRHAVRVLIRTPALTLASVATLALGIGANTAIFTIVYGVLLRPLPFRDPGRLVQLNASRPSRGNAPLEFSLPEFADWEARTGSFEALALFGFNQYSISGGDSAEAIRGAVVSGRFFDALGVGALEGRPLGADDDRVASVVISERLWTSRFGRDPHVVGQRVALNGQGYTVVGVAPRSLTFPAPDVDVWVPAEFSATLAPPQWRMRGFRAFSIIGRLRDGVGLPQAREDVTRIAGALAGMYPRFNEDTAATVTPLLDRLTARVRPALLLLFAAVGLVLLVACANVSSLSLARAAGRARDVATRTALGATRSHLIRECLAESAILAAGGAAAGLAVAQVVIALVSRAAPADLPRLDAVRLDGTALGFCAVVAVACVFLFGTLPALRLTRAVPADVLRDGRSEISSSTRRLHAWLVAGEVAVSVALVIGAALLTRSVGAMLRENIGVSDRGALTLKLNLASPAYADPAKQAAWLDRLLPQLAALPGVDRVGLSSHLPPAVSQMHTTVSTTNRTTGRQEELGVEIVAANAQLFRTLGIPLIAGRTFDAGDTLTSPRVAVLASSTARRLFPEGDALGRTIPLGPRGPSGSSGDLLIVGIVGDVRYSGFDAAPDGAIYLPYAQRPFRVMYLVVSSPGAGASIAEQVRRAVAALDPEIAVSDVRRIDEVVAAAAAQPEFRAVVLASMAGLALVLAGAGIGGVLAHAVAQRRREIGVRMALGADAARVRRMVVRHALGLSTAGCAAGVVGGFVLARVLGRFLYGVSGVDTMSFALGPALLLAVTAVASYLPARRATRVDPNVALRSL